MKKIKMPGFLQKINFIRFNFKTSIAAVEIGNDWLKIAQKDRIRPDKIVYQISLSKLAQINGSVALAIDGVFKSMKLNRKYVVSYIPRHLVTVRMLDLPATDPKEISDMINLQVGKQTPYSKEEVVSSHEIIERGATGYTKVMLVIAARNIINERTDALAKAGVNVVRVAISSEGVFNWFTAGYLQNIKLSASQGVVLVDIDSNYSDFMVIRRGKMIFTRNIFIGANHLMPGTVEWRDKFVEELKRSFERYQLEERGVRIVKIFLSGSGPNIKGLDVLLSGAMELPTENTDQLKDVRMRKGAAALLDEQYRFVSLTQLLGTPMVDKEPLIDLTTSEQKVQKLVVAKGKQLAMMGVLIVSIVTMFSLLVVINIYNKNTYLTKLKYMISKIGSDADSIETKRAAISLVEKRLDFQGSSIDTLKEIYELTPNEIYLRDIDIDEKQTIVLKGGGMAMSDVFKYVKILEESKMFEGVKTTYTTTKKSGNTEYAEFEISCAYQK